MRSPDALLQQVVGGRWRVLEALGPTEHGTIFRGEALEGGGAVRLELWDPRHVEERGELARFERQARTLSRLRHERCLSIVAFGAHEGRPFLVSELPEGRALRDELGKPELTLPRALSLGLQLCEGLRHLHGHGVVHRALVPENVWCSAESLKIGVPLISSAARSDNRADLQAAGRLLYAMCTGREVPEGGGPVPRPRTVGPERGISEGLEKVLLRAVAPSPHARFETADDLLTALESVGALPTTPMRPAQPSGKRTAFVVGGLAVVALLVAVVVGGGGSEERSAPPAAQRESVPAEPIAAPPPPPPPSSPKPVVVAPPPVEPKPAPPVPAPAPASAVTAKPKEQAPDERSEIWSLLDSGRTDEAGRRIKSLVFRNPEAAWPRLALGAFYYRKQWRGDAIKNWKLALAADPEIHLDPQFGAYLCFMLDDAWKAAGMTELLAQLGPKAVPLLDRCVASAKTARLRAQASRAIEGLRQAGQPAPRL
jgi:hypothetical protein